MANRSADRGLFIRMTTRERAAVLCALAVLVIVVGVVNVSHGRIDLALVWVAFVAYVMVLGLPFVFCRPGCGWMHPLIFTVLWWQLVRHDLPRLGVYATGLSEHRAASGALPSDLNAIAAFELCLTAIGLLALYAGYVAAGQPKVPRLRFGRPTNVVAKVGIVAGITLFALAMLVRQLDGIGQLMLFRGMGGDAREALIAEMGGRHWYFLATLLQPACLVWLALRPSDWRKPTFIAFFALALVVGFIGGGGQRSRMIAPLLMAGLIWMLRNRRVSRSAIAVGAVFVILVVGVGGQFVEAMRGARTLQDVELDTGLAAGMSQGLETIMKRGSEIDGGYGILSKVPDEVDRLYGRSYLSVLFAPIPSALLPFDKPQPGGKLNAIHVFENPYTQIPPGNIGEAYWNFGIPGVVIVMFLFGFVLKWFMRLYVVNGGAGWVTAIYVVTLFLLQPNSPAIYHWLHALAPVALFLVMLGGLPRRASRTTRWSPIAAAQPLPALSSTWAGKRI